MQFSLKKHGKKESTLWEFLAQTFAEASANEEFIPQVKWRRGMSEMMSYGICAILDHMQTFGRVDFEMKLQMKDRLGKVFGGREANELVQFHGFWFDGARDVVTAFDTFPHTPDEVTDSQSSFRRSMACQILAEMAREEENAA